MGRFLNNKQIFVVFTTDSVYKRWWIPFLKKPFHHCFLIYTWEEDGKHMALIRDPIVSFSKWSVKPLYTKPFQIVNYMSYLNNYRDICIYRNNIPPRIVKTKIFLDKYNIAGRINNNIPLCTSFIKLMLGIQNISAITPYQLYKLLCNKYGGIDVFK